MRLGVYGGSFDPIHLGHLHLLRGFQRSLALDRVLLIPAGEPPHKAGERLAPAEDRLRMCRLAAQGLAGVEVSDVETRREGVSLTADTLGELRRQYPGAELFILFGEDKLLTLDRWIRADEIMAACTLVCVPRSEDGLSRLREKAALLEREHGARCVILSLPWLDVSSTEVRARMLEGRSPKGLVPPEVEAYLLERGLYRGV